MILPKYLLILLIYLNLSVATHCPKNKIQILCCLLCQHYRYMPPFLYTPSTSASSSPWVCPVLPLSAWNSPLFQFTNMCSTHPSPQFKWQALFQDIFLAPASLELIKCSIRYSLFLFSLNLAQFIIGLIVFLFKIL